MPDIDAVLKAKKGLCFDYAALMTAGRPFGFGRQGGGTEYGTVRGNCVSAGAAGSGRKQSSILQTTQIALCLKMINSAAVVAAKAEIAAVRIAPNITIEGGIWDGNNANQDRCSRESRFALKEYDPEYYFGICLGIRGVRDFTFRNATISNPESYGIQISGAVYFTVENIFFDYNMKRLNMDGIHMAGPALCANPTSGLHESDLRSGLCGILFLYYIIDCGGGAAGDFTGQTT